jgi:GT2 family glycosyltransferase
VPALSIIILNYNLTDAVRACLRSLADVDAEIVVADNHSPDRSIEQLQSEFPHVKFLFLNTNNGFSHGNNAAAKMTTTEYLFILNPDTIVPPKTIEMLLQFIQAHPEVGVVAPMLEHPDGSFQFSYYDSPNLTWEVAEALYLHGIFREKRRKKDEDTYMNQQLPFEVNWAAGAALMIRKKVYDRIGGFDEDFFLIYEDVDLCDRIRDEGYKIIYMPTVKIIHQDGGIIKKNFYRLIVSRYHGRMVYIRKHFGFFEKSLVWVAVIIGLIIRLLITPFLYTGEEYRQRMKGYSKSCLVYLGFSKF